MYDVAKIRKDFPILDRQVNGVPLVYLDNAATSQKPRAVIQALSDYYERYNANVHRGAHTLAIEATEAYEEARAKVARFINAPSPANIVFVRNTTEAINLVAHTWAVANVGAGDRIVVTEMEHHSNLVPWQHVARTNGAQLKLMAMTSDYELDTSDLDELLTPATKLVALTHMSNVLGTITPVAEVVAAAHRVGALALVDAAQSVPHLPVDVQALDCDFMAFSGHKMLGPTGIGVLYAKEEVLEQMDPFLRGGEMVLEVTYEDATWNQVPLKFEAGTPNIGDAIALGAAVDYLSALGMDSVREHEVALTRYAMERFAELEEVTTFGPSDLAVRGGVVSFYMSEIHPHDIGQVLDQLGIAIRAGHHCAMPLVRSRLNVPATARASFYLYNTEAEIDALIDGLNQVLRYFGDAASKRA
ncbi:MAG: cysteine desulfurase [Chloroflexi bacterium]|nr:cysteine desulfurase [Chloroflexota bacterium]